MKSILVTILFFMTTTVFASGKCEYKIRTMIPNTFAIQNSTKEGTNMDLNKCKAAILHSLGATEFNQIGAMKFVGTHKGKKITKRFQYTYAFPQNEISNNEINQDEYNTLIETYFKQHELN